MYNNEIHELENSGPIGLSMMVSLAESYLQFLENRAINEALHEQPPISLKTHRRYVDDSHTRFQEIEDASKFKDILNKQDPRIQHTMEEEREKAGRRIRRNPTRFRRNMTSNLTSNTLTTSEDNAMLSDS